MWSAPSAPPGRCGTVRISGAPVARSRATVLAFFICLSTLLIKQHTVLDVAGGAALATAVGAVVYRRQLIQMHRRLWSNLRLRRAPDGA